MTIGEFKDLIADMNDDAEIVIIDANSERVELDQDTNINKYDDAIYLFV